MTAKCWVLIDETNGAACGNGETMNPTALARIAEACGLQLNEEYAVEHGGSAVVRAGSGPTDVAPGESVYVFVGTFTDPALSGASAYHDLQANGTPVAFCAITTCGSLLGPDGVGVDASHELCEAKGNPGCNKFLDDGQGNLHAGERCDAVEVQVYPKTCADGTVVYVSNFLLQSWEDPGAPPPYDFMSQAGIDGAVAPPGPMQTAPGNGGNYQIEAPFDDNTQTQVFAISGTRKKGSTPHPTSRAARILAGVK